MLGTARCGAGSIHGRNGSGGSMAAQPQKSTSDDQRGAHDLHQGQAIVEQESAAGIAAEEFDRAALNSIKDEIRADDSSRETPFRAEPDQYAEIQEFGGGFVQLSGMRARRPSGVPLILAATGLEKVTPHEREVGLP